MTAIADPSAHHLLPTSLLANLVSPIYAFNASEFVKWFAMSFSLTVLLGALAHRTSFGAVLEIFFVASSLVQSESSVLNKTKG